MQHDMVRKTSVVHASDLKAKCREGSPHVSDEVPDVAIARTQPLKLLRFAAVRDRTGLSRSTIWRLERRGDFPRHRRISPNAVAWVEHEILEWIASRISDVAV